MEYSARAIGTTNRKRNGCPKAGAGVPSMPNKTAPMQSAETVAPCNETASRWVSESLTGEARKYATLVRSGTDEANSQTSIAVLKVNIAQAFYLGLTPKFSGAGAKRRAPTPKGLASAATHS